MGRAFDAVAGQVPFDARVADLAGRQHGVFARRQLRGLGATKGMIQSRMKAGRWEQVAPSVFRLAGAPASWKQSLMAACLAWGTGAFVSHRAAAAFWGLYGFGPGVVELIVPRKLSRSGPGIVHRNAILAKDVTVVDGIPVTTPMRTLIDVGAVAGRDEAEDALDDALRRGIVTVDRLRRRIDELGRGHPGVGTMRVLLNARRHETALPGGGFERKVLRMIVRAGLPKPVLQYRIYRDGHLVAIVDFAYPELRLVIEVDGYEFHFLKDPWHKDRRRRNELTLLGWRTIHVTWADVVERPENVIAAIREALSAPAVPGDA